MTPERRVLRDLNAETQEELDFHIAALTAEYIAKGLTPDEASAAVRKRFGDLGDLTAALKRINTQRRRRMRLADQFRDIAQDLRHSFRQVVRAPGLAIVVILTMAVGIGATSATFSVLHTVLLRPLPFDGADRVLRLRERNGLTDTRGMFVTPGNYATWAAESREFEAMGGYYFGGYTLTGVGDPQRLPAILATASFWNTLAAPPALGRYYTPDEDRPGAAKVVVLAHATWRTVFAADSQIIGRAILLSGVPHTVIGVAAPEYAITHRTTAVYLPIAFSDDALRDHGGHELTVLGRVRKGATVDQAVAELTRIETALAQQYPNNNFDGGIIARSERDAIVGPSKAIMQLAFAAAGLVLLIACVNIAHLLLGRAAARRREVAVRAALGAGRARIIRQLLVESVVLATLGAAAGLGVAELAIRTLVRSAPPFAPRLADASLNGAVLAFTVGLALVSAIVFGLAPALRASRLDIQLTLRGAARGSTAGGRDRVLSALVVAEVALSLVLLVGAGLCVRSAVQLNRADPGFDETNLLVGNVSLPSATYPADADVARTFATLAERLNNVSGVLGATLVSRMPVATGGADCGVEGIGGVAEPGSTQGAQVRSIDPSYFTVMRTPMVKGRPFTVADGANAPPVVILTAGLARALFGDADPIGKRVTKCIPGPDAGREVVGVAAEVRANGLRDGATAQIYFPYAQVPQRTMWLAVRGGANVSSLAQGVRSAVADVDARLPVASVSTMSDVLARTMATQRFITMLLVLLGTIGCVLAAVGIYGVISYLVGQRMQEIAIRMALGARAAGVAGMVVRQAVSLALLGVALGAAVSTVAMRAVSGLLFEVTQRDPVTFGAGATGLVLIAALASAIPAWRAARVGPLKTLRE